MRFCIADTFTESLGKLTGQEQRAAKITAFDLQIDPANPGMKLHKLERTKDPNFRSIRAGRGLRIIVHKGSSSLMLCYVGHHDEAYAWAGRRRLEAHPKTGAARFVKTREIVEEVAARRPVEAEVPRDEKPALFGAVADDELLGFGIPAGLLDAVRKADEDTLFDLTDDLPQEAAEALLALAAGETPPVAPAAPVEADAPDHRAEPPRAHGLSDAGELERARALPWEKWSVFLPSAQQRYVERDYPGPALISGAAGTGKAVVALRRAAFLARRHRDAAILLTAFSKMQANALKRKLGRLVGDEPQIAERIQVNAIQGVGYDIYAGAFGQPNIASPKLVRSLLARVAGSIGPERFSTRFLLEEWNDVLDAWQLKAWEEYRDAARSGRGTRIGPRQREALWLIFELVRAELAKRKAVTWSDVFAAAAAHVAKGARPFDFAVVAEAQDMGVAEMRFLAALGAGRANGLFLVADAGSRLFRQPFSWKSLGVDVRRRSHTLGICYRTSSRIRRLADPLLPGIPADADGAGESHADDPASALDGPRPRIEVFDNSAAEAAAVGEWIGSLLGQGMEPHEIGLFVRDKPQVKRARTAARAARAKVVELDDRVETERGRVSVGAMDLAPGLEFRAVAVMACDGGVVPPRERIEAISENSELEEAYGAERRRLYLACTRARDHLLVTGVRPASEFLDDLAAA